MTTQFSATVSIDPALLQLGRMLFGDGGPTGSNSSSTTDLQKGSLPKPEPDPKAELRTISDTLRELASYFVHCDPLTVERGELDKKRAELTNTLDKIRNLGYSNLDEPKESQRQNIFAGSMQCRKLLDDLRREITKGSDAASSISAELGMEIEKVSLLFYMMFL